MGVKLVSASAGSVEIVAPATALNYTATLPTGSGTLVINNVNSSIVSGTVQPSTAGTNIDFTNIPSWAKRITVMLNGVSTNGASKVLVQIGDSGGIETSGYLGSVVFAESSDTATNLSSGFITDNTATAAGVRHGALIISQVDASAFSWVCFGNIGRSDAAAVSVVGGSKALSAALDRVRITTVNGTDTFDAGSINILYE